MVRQTKEYKESFVFLLILYSTPLSDSLMSWWEHNIDYYFDNRRCMEDSESKLNMNMQTNNMFQVFSVEKKEVYFKIYHVLFHWRCAHSTENQF